MTYEAEPVTAAIAASPSEALKEVARAAQKMAAAERAYQQRPSVQAWNEWVKTCSAFEKAGLEYARACAAVFAVEAQSRKNLEHIR